MPSAFLNILPSIGTTGLYRLAAPFDTALAVGVPYQCVGIRRIADIILGGVDPEQAFYIANSLTRNDYEVDLQNEVSILTLQSGNGHVVYVPNSYLLGYPDVGGVIYNTLAAVVHLGPIPNKLGLDAFKTKLIDVARDQLGITATVDFVNVAESTIVSDTDHVGIEAARVANITATSTDYAKYLQATLELTQARAKITELEHYIKLHPAP